MRLYEPVHVSFVRFCAARSYGIIETEDLVSETILQAFTGFEKLRDKKAFLAFLFSIATNIIRNQLRRKNKVMIVHEINSNIPDSSGNYSEAGADVEVLYKALSTLPDEQKDAIILFEISGFSIQEIAEIQNAGISSVKQRLKRGREKLTEIISRPDLMTEKRLARKGILMNLFF